MSKKYVCKFSFGSFKKGDPYKGTDRDTAKLLKNGMICPLMEGGEKSVKKPKAKQAPEVLTNLTEEQLAEQKENAKKEKAKKKREAKAKADLKK